MEPCGTGYRLRDGAAATQHHLLKFTLTWLEPSQNVELNCLASVGHWMKHDIVWNQTFLCKSHSCWGPALTLVTISFSRMIVHSLSSWSPQLIMPFKYMGLRYKTNTVSYNLPASLWKWQVPLLQLTVIHWHKNVFWQKSSELTFAMYSQCWGKYMSDISQDVVIALSKLLLLLHYVIVGLILLLIYSSETCFWTKNEI